MKQLFTLWKRHWRMSRRTFGLIMCGFGICVLTYLVTSSTSPYGGPLVHYSFLGIGFGLLALPFIVSMRLRDIGRSALWAVVPMIAMCVLIAGVLSTLAAVSGTPGSTDPMAQDRALELFSFAGVCMLGLLTLYALFAPTKSAAHLNEATP